MDPKGLRDEMTRQRLPIGPWADVCNSFVSPCERDPGVANLLVKKSEWDQVSDQKNLTLTFMDRSGASVVMKRLRPFSVESPLAQEYNAADPVLWVKLDDMRSRYRQVAVNKGFNLRAADGTWDDSTLNAGTPYTWAEIVSDLWAKLYAVYSNLGNTAPSFPATPSGTPESFFFWDLNAWDALCTVVQAAGYLVFFDPTVSETGAVEFFDPSVGVPAGETIYFRTWDTSGWTNIPEAVPADVQVSFGRMGRKDRYNVDASIAETGSTSGAKQVVPAYPVAAGDPVTNGTYLTAFAGRVAAFWRRDLRARSETRKVQYQGWRDWVRLAVGLNGYAAWGVSELGGDVVQSSLFAGPLLRLDPGEFVPGVDTGVCGDPIVFRVQVGTSYTTTTDTVSGKTFLTGITIKERFRDVTITSDGCYVFGEPYCEIAGLTCTDGEEVGSPRWWCVDGVCVKVYDGLTPTGDTVAGPYTTADDCSGACLPADSAPTCADVDPSTLPDNLNVTYSAPAGACSVACQPGAISDTIVMSRIGPGINQWTTDTEDFCPGVPGFLFLECSGGVYTFSWGVSGGGAFPTLCPDGGAACQSSPVAGTSSPFSLTYTMPVCCMCSVGTGGTVTVVISE